MASQIINSFPGYEFKEVEGFKGPQNVYRGEIIGFGGYIRSWPGIYHNVALLDVQSMHPSSAIAMNVFGIYTKNFEDILKARISIKHGDYDSVRKMFGGRLAKYLNDESTAKQLAQALKIAINSVYGLTSASFDNPFRDPRNKNNIVALRGALFMKTLQDEVTKRGFKIVAIKTDSIKIADATDEIINFCIEFAKDYGYSFDLEDTYDRICQINDADYVAKTVSGKWTATGKQFQVPYVFKTLFSKEPIEFKDKCETFQVKSALYLDMNEDIALDEAVGKALQKELDYRNKRDVVDDFIGYKNPAFKEVSDEELRNMIAKSHNYIFVGRVGQFCPIMPGRGGGLLMREQNGKYYAATGTKGYRWLESEMVRELGKEDDIDLNYYRKLVDEAIKNISQYGDFEAFVA